MKNLTFRQYLVVAVGLIGVTAVVLWAKGQVLICKCGYVKFWHGVVVSSENSQHLFDWYSFSHVIHGIIFYAVLSWLFPKLPVGLRLLMAIGIESAWELLENSDFIINRYREATIALDYYGDSVINSVCDILSCVAGFFLAFKMPKWASIALVIFLELFVLYCIRDNLTLNVVMLVYPLEAIKAWQIGG